MASSCVWKSGSAGRKRARRVARRAAQSAGVSRKARHSSIAAMESSLRSRRTAPGRGWPSSPSSSARSSLRPRLGVCSRTSKSKRSAGAEIGEAGGEAQDGEGAGVVPPGEHGVDRAGEEAHHGVAFQRGIEIEARGDAEAFEGGAQRGQVDVGGAHDDGDLAEGAARRRGRECGARCPRLRGRWMGALTTARAARGRREGRRSWVKPMARRRASRAGVRSSSLKVRVRSVWAARAAMTWSSGSGRAWKPSMRMVRMARGGLRGELGGGEIEAAAAQDEAAAGEVGDRLRDRRRGRRRRAARREGRRRGVRYRRRRTRTRRWCGRGRCRIRGSG